ncbi:MAG: hypothetical protein AAFX05_09270 [Planctomycetota bacterium]
MPDVRRCLWLSVLLVLGGCSSATIDRTGWGPVEGTRSDASSALLLVDAYPELQTPGSRSFQLDGKGTTGPGRFGASRIDGALHLLVEVDGVDPPITDRTIEIAGDGTATIPRMIERDRGVLNVFEPPLVLFPTALEAGDEFTQELELRVYPLETPKKLKERASTTLTITDLGVEQYVLGDGGDSIPTRAVRHVLAMDFGPAIVRSTTDRWFVPGRGLVAEESEVVVKVFGLEVERSRSVLRATE